MVALVGEAFSQETQDFWVNWFKLESIFCMTWEVVNKLPCFEKASIEDEG